MVSIDANRGNDRYTHTQELFTRRIGDKSSEVEARERRFSKGEFSKVDRLLIFLRVPCVEKVIELKGRGEGKEKKRKREQDCLLGRGIYLRNIIVLS